MRGKPNKQRDSMHGSVAPEEVLLIIVPRRVKSPYTLSVAMQVKLCIERGFQRLRGDMSLTLSSMIGNSIMALIIGSVFYNLPANTGSFYYRGALLFFAILLNAFSSFLEVGTFVSETSALLD